jgi:lipopolysaccharide transport system ATP-binding protein
MYIRLAFAVAAHLEPDVLLVDEVLAVGDAEFQKRCLGRMHEVAGQGRTVLFVSHNLPAVQRLCDRAFLLDGGRLVDSGPVDAVLDRYYRLVTEPEDAIERRVVPEGRVGYVGWSVVGSEETDFAHAYRSGDDVEFEFELVARRSLDLAQFSLSIHDAVGNFIVGTRRGVEIEDCIPLAPGTYRIRFAFPHLELKPGYYTLTAIAGNMREGLVEEWAAHPRLQVLPRSDAPADAWGGMIDARGTVEIVPDAVPQRV